MKKITLIFSTICLISITQTSCKKKGCTNKNATNYNSKAKKDDGSCIIKETTDNSTSDQSYQLKANIDGTENTFTNISAGQDGDRAIISGTIDNQSISVYFYKNITLGEHNYTYDFNTPSITYNSQNNQLYFTDASLPGNFKITELDSISPNRRYIKGTFNCTLKHQNNGTTKAISGSFKGVHWRH